MRLSLSLGGMTFAVVLVLLLRGIMDGTVANSTAYIDRVGADVFVGQQGVTNMTLASSILPAASAALFESPDADRVAGIIRFNMIVGTAADNQMPAQLVGYPIDGGFGGPWKMRQGRAPREPNEAVVDSVLARSLGITVGDSFDMVGTKFQVVGLSSETAGIAAKFVFVSLADAQQLLGLSDRISFVLIDLHEGVDADSFVAGTTELQPGFSIATRAVFSRRDRALLFDLFVGPINVMSSIGLLVGLAVVGLTMYTTTNERLPDFGVLKAIGAPNGFLFRTVFAQSLAIGLIGFVLGLLVSLVAGPIIEHQVADIDVTIRVIPALWVLAAVLGMSLGAALIPVVRIVRVDPLLVFKQ